MKKFNLFNAGSKELITNNQRKLVRQRSQSVGMETKNLEDPEKYIRTHFNRRKKPKTKNQ